MAHPGRDAGLHQVTRAQHVVGDRVLDVGFHQRYVLVRGRVEDDLRTMRREDRGQAVGVADVGDDGRDPGSWKLVAGYWMLDTGFSFQLQVSNFQTLHLIVDVEDAVLAVTQQHQFGGTQAGDLAAQFRADRPTSARHQHALAAHQRRHLRRVDLHRRAAQQILDLYFPELADADRCHQSAHTSPGRYASLPRLCRKGRQSRG